MHKKNIGFELAVYDTLDELPEQDRKLMETAIAAREDAYSPYSNFKVGAAVKMASGEVVIGNNQENASYPSGLCAERVAVFQAAAIYPGVPITTIAISAASMNYEVDRPAAPCGNCRQSISEYEFRQDKPIRLLLMGAIGQIYACNAIADILPLGFNNTYL